MDKLDEYAELRRLVKRLDAWPGELTSPIQPERAYYPTNYDDEGDGIDFREYFRRLRRHKWLILSIVIIVTTLATIRVYRTKDWYTASTVLEIGKENSTVLKSGSVTLNDDMDPNYLVNVNTKKLALDDPGLFREVVIDQKLDQNPKIMAIMQKKSLFSFLGSSDTESPKGNTQIVPVTQPGGTEKTDLAQTAAEALSLEPLVAYLQNNTTVEQIKNTRALRISYTNEDPVLAASISNAIAKIFRQNSFETQTERYTNSADWLDRSTRELKSKVEIAEQALAGYTRDNQIYATEAGTNADKNRGSTLTTSKLIQLHDQYTRTQTDRILKQSLFEQVQAGRIAELPDAFSDPKILAAQKQLGDLTQAAAELKVKYGPDNPKIQEVRSQISDLEGQIETSRKALAAKLKADYQRAVQDEQSLQSALNRSKLAAVDENQASIKYNILKQDVETARGLYTDFLQKTNQAKAQIAEQNNNIKVIQNAVIPASPVGPQRMQVIAIGFFFGLLAGIGLALFLDYLDDTIKSLDDVERYVQLPMLGVIPSLTTGGKRTLWNKDDQKQIALSENGSHLGLEIKQNSVQSKLLSNLDGHSIAGEAYRALRTSLLMSSAGNPPKTILITSSMASEGKTTTAVNTAISLAQLGAQVMIIDCDLRRPSLHKQLDISSAKGVSNYLSANTELASLIQKLEIPNLSVIPSGPIPPNPAELLSSPKMKEMIQELGRSFDHIIIDSPPIGNVTDPIILSTIVDGTTMVIHGGKTSRAMAQRSRKDLLNVGSKIFGVVLNNVDLRKEGYDYYYYRYHKYEPDDRAEPLEG